VQSIRSSAFGTDESIASQSCRESELDELVNYFGRTPVTQIAPRPTTGSVRVWKAGDVACVHRGEKTALVFTKLVTEGFLSAPVLDSDHKFIGFIDMLDLVMFTVDLFVKEGLDPQTTEGWSSFVSTVSAWRDSNIEDVLAHVEASRRPRKSALYPMQISFTVLQAMSQFASLGTHRAVVLDDKNQVAGIMTQSMIISLLDQNLGKLGKYRSTQVNDLHSVLGPLVTVRDDSKAIEAFKLMADRGLSGLAVVDEKGFLVDNISVRDLRGIGQKPTDFTNLFQTVKVFKERERTMFPVQIPSKPIYCKGTSTIEDLVKLMDDGNMHRVFEVDEQGQGEEQAQSQVGSGSTGSAKLKPCKVVTQTDLIRFLALKMGVWTSSCSAAELQGSGSGGGTGTGIGSVTPFGSPSRSLASGSASGAVSF